MKRQIWNLKQLNSIAQSKGGKCLSKKYINATTKLKWECKEGHIWKTSPFAIYSRGSWCPKCAGIKKLTIQEMRLIAKDRKGKCLSSKYVNASSKLTWQCNKGHIWDATPNKIKNGSWCPTCSGRTKLSIKTAIELAISKGGKCHSKTYKNKDSLLSWECSQGHKWKACLGSVRNQNTWCPKCSRVIAGLKRRLKLDDLQSIAKKNGGKCLSKEYKTNTKLKWECSEGHIWHSNPFNIKAGKWCPRCAGSGKGSVDINDLRMLAKSRNGKLISKKYNNNKELLEWECNLGHRWEANYSSIKRPTWCPQCKGWLGERICREVIQDITGKLFPKVKPQWLKNSKGNRMELDGYCKELGVAFEHQGEQHYSNTSHFISDDKELKKRKRDDKRKEKLCIKHNVILIIIPEVPTRTNYTELLKLIKKTLKENKIPHNRAYKKSEIPIKSLYYNDALDELENIARKKGGKLLSNFYLDTRFKLEWKCKKGHTWKATPTAIKSGKWCPKCGLERFVEGGRNQMRKIGPRLGKEQLKALAKKQNGFYISDKNYEKSKKLTWKCKKGHTWDASLSHVKNGKWCPMCAIEYRADKKRTSDNEINSIARKKGGKCLSKYTDSKTKLKWRCKKGHTWESFLAPVKKGGWCPYCSGRVLDISDMHKLAKKNGGKCLSKKYNGTHTPLKWTCKNGHTWLMPPTRVKSGRWCPKCGKVDIRDMHKLASSFGGKCVSKRYINCNTKLQWQCRAGHIWKATPTYIKLGHWCSICSKSKRYSTK